MKSLLTILFFIILPLAVVLGLVFYSLNGTITIVDSGSTDAPGFTLLANVNGSGIWTNALGIQTPFDSFTVDYNGLVKAIRKPEVLVKLFVTKPSCAHPASSGGTERLTYNFLTSGDVTCISDQDFQTALSSVVETARNQAR